ncbi:membrane-associated lipoprotein involved in thiamine biosynthesis (plasmid) [Mycobacterium sp. JS623]|uniref:FAD:protein FMN transferase n=1 Tax=Mycobacterium sp. JS623 TaxID=212767 RepID=UPI0002A54CC4|nr:FAD:protein FMN transferase [Mycobacterium sp. JS623]AGB26806.1 membrane-associated lipoprotein involved in thiamine biosynthesis [Mycobacterium sp. JS623]
MTNPSEQLIDSGAGTATTRWQRWSMSMQIVVTNPDSLAVARREVDAELDTIEVAASRFRPDSEINALAASAGRPTPVSQLLAELLGAAMTAARQTDGDVDPTIGATLIALGYDGDIGAVDDTHRVTASISVPARWSMVRLEDRVVTVPPGIRLDLGATAKAVAADRCADRAHRVTDSGVLINLGGDIATAGPEPDGGWRVLVLDDAEDPAGSVALSSGAGLATSSTIHRRWRRGADLVHHIVDPRTGWSADPVWRTVSVAGQTCLAANTVSTASIIRGWRALDWIRALDIPARLVDSERNVHTLCGWPADANGAWQ